MADIKISQLGEALAVTDNDILPMTASGVTSKVKASTMKSYMVDDLDVSDLHDTTITTPTDNDGLVYDSTSQKWENVPITTKEQWKKNGAYNHLENKGVSQALGGIVFSVSGGVTIAVVPSEEHAANFDIVPSADKITLPAGKYKLICLPSSAQDIYCQGFGNHDYTSGLGIIDTGDGVEFTLTQENDLYFFIHIGATANAGTYIFKPMITTDLNATYDDFVEFAKTNRELTEDTKYVVGTLNTAAFTGTGMTLRSGNLYKYGKVVNFIFDIQKDSGVDPLTVTGLLPVGFRPITGFSIRCGDGSPFGVSNVQITESGALYIYFGSTGYAIGSATFITND